MTHYMIGIRSGESGISKIPFEIAIRLRCSAFITISCLLLGHPIVPHIHSSRLLQSIHAATCGMRQTPCMCAVMRWRLRPLPRIPPSHSPLSRSPPSPDHLPLPPHLPPPSQFSPSPPSLFSSCYPFLPPHPLESMRASIQCCEALITPFVHCSRGHGAQQIDQVHGGP